MNEKSILLVLTSWLFVGDRCGNRRLLHQLHDRFEVVLPSGRISIPLILLWTQTGMTYGHISGISATETVFTSGTIIFVQVMFHHTGMRTATGEHRIVHITPEVGLRSWLRISDPVDHLLECGKPNVLFLQKLIQKFVQCSHVSSSLKEFKPVSEFAFGTWPVLLLGEPGDVKVKLKWRPVGAVVAVKVLS